MAGQTHFGVARSLDVALLAKISKVGLIFVLVEGSAGEISSSADVPSSEFSPVLGITSALLLDCVKLHLIKFRPQVIFVFCEFLHLSDDDRAQALESLSKFEFSLHFVSEKYFLCPANRQTVRFTAAARLSRLGQNPGLRLF